MAGNTISAFSTTGEKGSLSLQGCIFSSTPGTTVIPIASVISSKCGLKISLMPVVLIVVVSLLTIIGVFIS